MKPLRVLPTMLLLCLLAAAVLPATSAADADDGARVEVVEFFWYGCPHCYRFQPYLHDWLEDRPDYVEFRQVPAMLAPDWEIHARAFYAAQLLEELDRFHAAFYDAIHQDGRQLDSIEDIADFAATLGIDGERFASTMESFAVEHRLREARNLGRDYRVRGTPSVGVAGEHTVSPSEAGSFEEMIRLVEQHAASAHGDND